MDANTDADGAGDVMFNAANDADGAGTGGCAAMIGGVASAWEGCTKPDMAKAPAKPTEISRRLAAPGTSCPCDAASNVVIVLLWPHL